MAKQKIEKIGLTKALEKLTGKQNINQVFDDFLKMTVCVYSLGRMEDEYKNIVQRYDADELPLFGAALGELIVEHECSNSRSEWVDVVGTTFEQINSASTASRMGQFFTPISLCRMMAEITKDGKTEGSVSDPTCGSSRNLIDHAQLHPNNRFHFWYFGSDLDERCVNMSVINFIMFGMKGVIIHMDALRMQVFKGYRVYLPETGLGVLPLCEKECWKYITEHKEVESDKPIIEVDKEKVEEIKQVQQLTKIENINKIIS